MIKQYARKTGTRPSWLVSRSYLVPVVFVVAFAGIGVRLLLSSYAQTPCTKQDVRVGKDNNCVLQVQRMLDATDSHWGGLYLKQNSDFNSLTEVQVKKFQTTQADQLYRFTKDLATGTVNKNTWQEICYADNIWHGNRMSFITAGCQVSFGVKWGSTYPALPWSST